MIFKRLAAAACLGIGIASSAIAATVTVDGQDYVISPITGTFTELQSLLESQIWWGDVPTSFKFVDATELSAGHQAAPSAHLGLIFGHTLSGGTIAADVWSDSNGDFHWFGAEIDETYVWATAEVVSAVPLPAGGVLLLSGLAGLKRRKKRAA